MPRRSHYKRPDKDNRTFHRRQPTYVLDSDGCMVDATTFDDTMHQLFRMCEYQARNEAYVYRTQFPEIIDAILNGTYDLAANTKKNALGRKLGVEAEEPYPHHRYNMSEMLRFATASKIGLMCQYEGIRRCIDEYYITHANDYPNPNRADGEIRSVVDAIYDEYMAHGYQETIARTPKRRVVSNILCAYDKHNGDYVTEMPIADWKISLSATDGHYRSIKEDKQYVYFTMPFSIGNESDARKTENRTLVFRKPSKPFFHEDGLRACAPDIVCRARRDGYILEFQLSLVRGIKYQNTDWSVCVSGDSGIARDMTMRLVKKLGADDFATSVALSSSRKLRALHERNERRRVNVESLKRCIEYDKYREDYAALRVHTSELAHVYRRIASTKDEINRHIAYAMVALARLSRGFIALEELSWSPSMQSWDRAKREEKIRVVAARFGVEVRSCSPAYTSRLCPVDGGELKFDAVTRVVSCSSCGYSADRDDTAALNIGVRALNDCSRDKKTDDNDDGAVVPVRRRVVFSGFRGKSFSIDRLVKRGRRASTGSLDDESARQIIKNIVSVDVYTKSHKTKYPTNTTQ